MKQIKLAIVGATGAVGAELLQVLEKRNFPIGELRLFASARSRGKKLSFGEKPSRRSAVGTGVSRHRYGDFQRRQQSCARMGAYSD